MDIKKAINGLSRSISNNVNVSTSPDEPRNFSPESSFRSQFSGNSRPDLRRGSTHDASRQLKPFNTKEVKILLLENVNEVGQKILREQGYQVEVLKTALNEDDLIEKIKYVPRISIEQSEKVLIFFPFAEMCMC